MEGGASFAYAVFNTGSADTSMSDESEGAIANGRIGRLLLEHWWPAALGPAPVRDLPTWHR
jgi:beta-lactamase class A